MKTVFLGGSRRVSRLNESIRRRLDELVQRKLRIVVGDANGADRAMQRQLSEWGYHAVTVYHVGTRPRNNEGSWPTLRVDTPRNASGFEFYAAKDSRMAGDAECGLMLWDGQSRGTLENVRRLVQACKPVAVYVAPIRKFVSVRGEGDLRALQASRTGHEISPAGPIGAAQKELPLGARRIHASKGRRGSAA